MQECKNQEKMNAWTRRMAISELHHYSYKAIGSTSTSASIDTISSDIYSDTRRVTLSNIYDPARASGGIVIHIILLQLNDWKIGNGYTFPFAIRADTRQWTVCP